METSYYGLYEDDTMEGTCPKAPPEELKPTQDAAPEHYLNASVVLPRGDKLAQVKVIGHKCDTEGNTIVRANAQTFLDTMWYEVKFGDGEITKLTANVIA